MREVERGHSVGDYKMKFLSKKERAGVIPCFGRFVAVVALP